MKDNNNVIAQWDEAADRYTREQEQSGFVELNKAIVRERFTDLRGKTALDLGCGYGWYTEHLRSVGADVTGCDGSSRMLTLARESYPQCNFVLADIEKPLPFDDSSFDLVFCNQVLMDIENLKGLAREVSRILKTGGTLYMSIVHPAFYDAKWVPDEDGFCGAKIMERYLSPYCMTNNFWGKTSHFHRPLGTYFNILADAGLSLLHVEEPASYDGVTKSAEFPLFLFAEFGKKIV